MAKCQYDEEIECEWEENSRTWDTCIPCRLASIVRQLKTINFGEHRE